MAHSRRARLVLIPATAALVLALLAQPASAQDQDLRGLADRIERLQRDVDVLQRQLARGGGSAGGGAGGAASPGFIAQTDQRFADTDAQLRDLTNRVEGMSRELREISARLDKLVGDVDFRLSTLERGGSPGAPGPQRVGASPSIPAPAAVPTPAPAGTSRSGAASGSPQLAPGEVPVRIVPGGPTGQSAPAQTATGPQTAAVPPGAGAVKLPEGPPEAQYEYAYGLLRKGQLEGSDFAPAEEALRAFLVQHPTHRLAGNAQYWLGETYFVRKDYQQSAAAFAEGFKRYPNSDKAPDNLLKLGMSLANLKRTREACGTFGELERRYPQAAVTIKQTLAREKQRASCT